MEKECEELESDINEKNKKQAILKYEAQQTKAECSNLRDAIHTLQFRTLNVKEVRS